MVENAGRGAAPSIVDAPGGQAILLTGRHGVPGAGRSSSGCSATSPRRRIVLLVRSQTGSTSRRARPLPDPQAGVRRPARAAGRRRRAAARSWTSGSTSIDGDFSRGVPAAPGRHRHRDPLRGDRSASTRRSTRGSRRTCSARMNLYRGVIASGIAPRLVHVSTAYVAGVAEGRDPGGPARPQGRLAARGASWRCRRAATSRRQSREPEMLERLHGQGREGALARRSHDGGRRRRGAPQGLGDRSA